MNIVKINKNKLNSIERRHPWVFSGAITSDVTNLKDEVALREQLDLDSMDFLDIVMELKKRHKIEVPQEDYTRLASMQSCVEYLAPKFNA